MQYPGKLTVLLRPRTGQRALAQLGECMGLSLHPVRALVIATTGLARPWRLLWAPSPGAGRPHGSHEVVEARIE